MRIHSEAAFLVCLCLWINVAKSQNADFVPDDEESSGDGEEFSGSGSGDHDLKDFEMATQANANTTKTAWVTDASVRLPDQTTTPLVPNAQTSHPITKAPRLHTTTVPETPSPTSGKVVVTVKGVFGSETTEAYHEETRSFTAEKLPQLPVTTELWTTTSPIEVIEEDTTKLVMLVKEKGGTMISSEHADWSTDTPKVEATAWPLSTTGPREPADSEASGNAAETTTVQATTEVSFIEDAIIPEVKQEVNRANPNDGDFDFENENPKTISDQPLYESPLGNASENESLLEKKEVLAGVVAGGVVGLAFAIMLVALMVYRMKKKDEGSYALDEHKQPNGGYCKPQRQEEFLA
ncbi:hypothetical protein P4O66_011620 [Electrophorus voltai]|uniref:Syndecan n=1 Tax=Electrophorus voltai TaxID=2609070 RepID=A0AAD9DUH1_9TELE|nr:hypothetical protein P4O66_011620 [Electrophorus voltai]